MSKDELIVKQQLEIESLKEKLEAQKQACDDATLYLYRPEQWSLSCPDFPKVAMKGILKARDALQDI